MRSPCRAPYAVVPSGCEATIARVVDARLRDALAAEFRDGRQLVVATTDFDLGVGRT